MDPRALSVELRTSQSAELRLRRAVFGLSLLGSAAMMLIGLYQMGILKRLPDLPGKRFDADRVDASKEAYALADTPDAALGLVSYGVTAALAARGEARRSRRMRGALLGKLVFDALQGLRLTVEQWTKYRAFCVWCLIAAGCSFVSLPLGIAEWRLRSSKAA